MSASRGPEKIPLDTKKSLNCIFGLKLGSSAISDLSCIGRYKLAIIQENSTVVTASNIVGQKMEGFLDHFCLNLERLSNGNN